MNILSSQRRARSAWIAALAVCFAPLAPPVFAQAAAPGAAKPPEAGKESPQPGGKEKTAPREVAVLKTTLGTIVFEFLPDVAPNMVANFKDLAKSGFYDGTTFHRVIPRFMIQGGDPNSKDDDPTNDGSGGSPRKMKAEFTRKYRHTRGIVSTARTSDPDSGSCQFFIMHGDNPGLDNQYTIFGRVVQGIEVVDKIATTSRDPNDRPFKNVVMEKVTIETRP
ncbi:MAG: peptidylprolyl isomerase [Candidatus Polarisedimenticolia bacterium]